MTLYVLEPEEIGACGGEGKTQSGISMVGDKREVQVHGIVIFRKFLPLGVEEREDGIEGRLQTPGMDLHHQLLALFHIEGIVIDVSRLVDAAVDDHRHLDFLRLFQGIVRLYLVHFLQVAHGERERVRGRTGIGHSHLKQRRRIG